MKRRAASTLAALLATAPLATTALTSTPASAIVLPSGMTLGGQVEPANATALVTSVSISAQDGEMGVASLSTSGGKTYFDYHFKVVGPGTVTWRVMTNVGTFSGSVATGKVNLSKTGGMVREWNLCAKTCSEPVAQPMGR
jgi:hypothetical protein